MPPEFRDDLLDRGPPILKHLAPPQLVLCQRFFGILVQGAIDSCARKIHDEWLDDQFHLDNQQAVVAAQGLWDGKSADA